MRVLGIDPGSIKTGYGIIEEQQDRPAVVTFGVIRTRPGQPLSQRLVTIHDGIADVASRFHPQSAALESAFVSRNAQSALKLGHARGVCLLVLEQVGLPIQEYAPAEVKSSVTGHGRAGKDQIGRMVRMLLGVKEEIAEDAADALAVALCHWQRHRSRERMRRATR